jgi:putative transposase
VAAAETPHHITQRGNARRVVFETDSDRLVYLDPLGQYCRLHSLSVLGYCLMPNHVHLVAVPSAADSMALALRHTHGRYAAYLNSRQTETGHVWQGRFYSCPLDRPHLWAALRYTERNPVRACMVAHPHLYAWSSAAAHTGGADPFRVLDLGLWRASWDAAAWQEYLGAADAECGTETIRRCTHTGRPLGEAGFVAGLERSLSRRLAPQKGGRPRKRHADSGQEAFAFAAAGGKT